MVKTMQPSERGTNFTGIDFFNIRPAMFGFLNRQENDEVVEQVETKREMLLVKEIVCSHCGLKFKRSLPFDLENSTSGIDRFCRQECAKAFSRSSFELLTTERLAIIRHDLARGYHPRTVAKALNVSPLAIMVINDYETAKRNRGKVPTGHLMIG